MAKEKKMLDHEEVDTEGVSTRQYSIWERLVPKINTEMLPTKITYLLWGGLIGSYHIYLIPFFISIGLSVSQAGIITGMISISYSFAGPFWGMVVDYTGRRKTILIILVLVSTATVFSLPWIAATLQDQSTSRRINSTNSSTGNATNDSSSGSSDDTYSMFQIYFLLITLGAIFFSTLPGYIDAVASQVIKQSRAKASYGSQRIFGSIGTCVIMYLSGVAVDNVKIPGMSDFTIAFVMYVPFAVLLVPVGCYLINQTETREKETKIHRANVADLALIDSKKNFNEESEKGKSVLRLLGEQFKRLDVLIFLLTAFISGLAFSLFIYFTILLLDNETHISKSRIGLIFSIASASGAIMFPFTAKIIKLLKGPLPAISLGVFSYSIRYIIMSYVSNYWVIASIQTLNCLGFALLWTAMMDYIHTISPPRIKVTMILVLQSVHFGIGPFTMNIVGGKLYDLYGGRLLFRCYGMFCGVWGVLGFVKFYVSRYLYDKKNVTEVEVKNGLIEE